MDFEEALKIVNNILHKDVSVEVWTNFGWMSYKDQVIRKLAEEILNAFQFGIKW